MHFKIYIGLLDYITMERSRKRVEPGLSFGRDMKQRLKYYENLKTALDAIATKEANALLTHKMRVSRNKLEYQL